MRVALNIAEDQLARVDALARRRDWTRDEAVQRSLEILLAEPEPKPQLSHEEEEVIFNRVFGSWKHLGIDGLEWQRKLRAEWDREAPAE